MIALVPSKPDGGYAAITTLWKREVFECKSLSGWAARPAQDLTRPHPIPMLFLCTSRYFMHLSKQTFHAVFHLPQQEYKLFLNCLSLQWHSFPYFVFLFPQVIGLHGYCRLLALCMFTSKILYCQWAALAKEDDIFVIKTTKRLSNLNNWSEEEHIKFIRGRILGKSNEELARVNLLTC